MNTITTSNHDNGNGNGNAPVMTDAQLEAIIDDAEFISVILSEKGTRHMIGALSLSLAVAFASTGYTLEEAKEKAGEILDAALDKAFEAEMYIN